MSETKKEAATAITAYVKTTRSNVTKKAGNRNTAKKHRPVRWGSFNKWWVHYDNLHK